MPISVQARHNDGHILVCCLIILVCCRQAMSFPVLAAESTQQPPWMSEGLLISSFRSGLARNPMAQQILHQGLRKAAKKQEISAIEDQLADSVRASPCNGPDVGLLDQLEALEDTDETMTSSTALRMVYIPTAMYAPRLDSTNSIGKQRQRAKADGRKRRKEIVELVLSLSFPNVHVITVDFETGGVTHPERYGTTNDTTRRPEPNDPANARDALSSWQPHFIYIQGGNTFWLHHHARPYGALLTEALTSGGTLFCGASAGAILTGRSIAPALWKGWDDPNVVPESVDWDTSSGLDLLGPFSCFPHYDETWKDVVRHKGGALLEQDSSHQILTIADHQVLHVDGIQKQVHYLLHE